MTALVREGGRGGRPGTRHRWSEWLCTAAERQATFQANCDGAAILEFAVILPVATVLLAGAVELGRALYIHRAVEQAVRGGARYLARVPDPTCTPACSWGAARAIRLTREQIISNTGIAAGAVRVALSAEPPFETVAMTAEVDLPIQLFSGIAVVNSWTLTVSHEEQRTGE